MNRISTSLRGDDRGELNFSPIKRNKGRRDKVEELKEIKRQLRGNIPEKDFWTSRAISGYFTDISKAILEKYGPDFNMVVTVEYNIRGDIAYTTFSKIVLNAACKQVKKIPNKSNKLLYLKGLLAHELSHVLYMDKQYKERYYKSLLAGRLLPRIPNMGGREKAFVEAIKDKKKANALCKIIKWVENSLEDGYGENTYLANYYGSLVDGMKYMRREFYKDLSSAPNTEKQLTSENPSERWQSVTSIILCYSLYHKLKNAENCPLSTNVVERISKIVQKTLSCNYKERLACLNEIIVELWDFIEPLLPAGSTEENNEGNSGNNPDANGNDAENESDAGQDDYQQTGKPSHENDNGMTRPVALDFNQAQAKPYEDDEDSDSKDIISPTDSMEDSLEEQILDELSKKKLEQQNLIKLNNEANEGKACGCLVQIYRDVDVSDKEIKEYDEYSEELEVSRRIQRVLKQQLEDRRKGGKRNGLYMGRKVEVRQVIRNDGKCFYNNKLPVDIPRICVQVLIDESGSMDKTDKRCISRISYAKKTAVIIEDFCRMLKFPVSIVGTTADWQCAGKSELTMYSSFDCLDGNDKYRIMKISSKGCNRDGAAFAFALQQFQKIPEEIKILFIVSDGRPNAFNYGGITAVNELKELNDKAKKSGVVVFAAAIGEDKKQIEAIYGDSFLDITDMDSMSKIFIDKIKSFIKK